MGSALQECKNQEGGEANLSIRALESLPDASYQAHPDEPVSGDFGGGWQVNIFEELTNAGIVSMAKGRGYHDFKYMLHGNRDSAPLNIRIHIERVMAPCYCVNHQVIGGNCPRVSRHFGMQTPRCTSLRMSTQIVQPRRIHFLSLTKVKHRPSLTLGAATLPTHK